ncbi:thiamine-binding protein [Candidatus Bathyarchaeota archaeon]|nr:MAG: thiamine-binding protein [Candidatus Bathyarchaeota archaeon]
MVELRIFILVVKIVVIAELNITPLGEGTSVGRLLAPVMEELKRLGVKYQVTPMCTVFEAENLEKVFEVVKSTHEVVFKAGAKRVITTVKIDDRRDVKVESMLEKVESLKKILEEKK